MSVPCKAVCFSWQLSLCLVNLLVDMLYAYFDPRIRVEDTAR